MKKPLTGFRVGEPAPHPAGRHGMLWSAVVLTAALCCDAGVHEAAAARTAATASAAADGQPAEESLIGLAREDVIRSFGRPQASRRVGDREILLYPNGVRVDLIGDQVVAFQAREEAFILAKDGTRYAPSDIGVVQRVSGPGGPTGRTDSPATPAAPEAPATAVADPSAAAGGEPACGEPVVGEEEAALSPIPEPVTPGSLEYLKQESGIDFPEEEAPPPGAGALGQVIGMFFRLGFMVLVLALAMKWTELPFYVPDLIKVGALTVAVREAIHGLGGIGGTWELLRFFRVGEVVAFFSMAVFLFKFEVTRTGLTALKIAAATYLVTYFLMLIVGLLLVFAVGMFV